MMLFGLPDDDAPRVTRWRDAILGLGHTLVGGERAARAVADYRAARDEMRPYVDALLVARRALPRDDLASALAHATVDGTPLSDDEALGFFQLLVLAGTETTSGLITNAVLCLLDHPAEHARLRAAPESLPAVIEEVLRFRTPVQVVFRVARADVALRGRTIPAGALVLLMLGSANRDPRHFRDAHRFDPRRFATSPPPAAHVAFGHGAHFCLGAALARLETRVALAALLARAPAFNRDGHGPWAPRAGLNVHGPRSLPVLLGTGRS
jgi:cytochrome P450